MPDPVDEASYAPALASLGLIHWITEPDWHRLFRDWLIEHPEDRDLYASAKRSALSRVEGADHQDLGFGMRYNTVKQPVVREIYARVFRAAGLV